MKTLSEPFEIPSLASRIIMRNRLLSIGVNIARLFTHPVVASLDHPLFRRRERGFKKFFLPSLRLVAERVDQRSVVGVSKFAAMPLAYVISKALLSVFVLLFWIAGTASAQDLNARVQVVSPKIQTTNKHAFQTLETAMKDFLNGRKWCADEILPQERIDCAFVLNITTWDGSSNFSGELQVQSSRPVFNSSYASTLLNILDKDIDFTYTEGQPIDYTDQNFQSNLSSIMAFYAYIIVGMDYDTFSKFGGTPYFASAQNVVTNAASASYKGWKAFDGTTNRYWLAENLSNQLYQPLRAFMYDYHRNGLDVMADNTGKGRKVIADLIPSLSQVDRQRLGAMFPLVFFTAKSDEFISIFSKADPQQRVAVMNVLNQADPANGLKYQALQKN